MANFVAAKGLHVMYAEFLSRGWHESEIHIFVKPSGMSPADRELCEGLEKIGKLPVHRTCYFKVTIIKRK